LSYLGDKIKKFIILLVILGLIGGCATAPSQRSETGCPKFLPATSPFGFGGPDKDGNIRDVGWIVKLTSLMAGAGIPQVPHPSGCNR